MTQQKFEVAIKAKRKLAKDYSENGSVIGTRGKGDFYRDVAGAEELEQGKGGVRGYSREC